MWKGVSKGETTQQLFQLFNWVNRTWSPIASNIRPPSSFPRSSLAIRIQSFAAGRYKKTDAQSNVDKRETEVAEPKETKKTKHTTNQAKEAESQRKKVIVIGGPTGNGKSLLAIQLAQKIDGEIISLDSVQVFRHVKVGVNLVGPEAQSLVKHHLLSFVDPTEEYSVAHWYEDAVRCIEDIHSRNKIPIVAGGSTYYLKWLIEGKVTSPAIPRDKEAEYVSELKLMGWDAALEKLKAMDPVRAEQMVTNNWRRLCRAILVAETTKQQNHTFLPAPDSTESPYNKYDMRMFWLTQTKTILFRQLDARCEEMIMSGLLNEVLDLRFKYGVKSQHQISSSIGYEESFRFIDLAMQGRITEDQFYEYLKEFQGATRHLASKQIKWGRDYADKFFYLLDYNVNVLSKIINICSMPRNDYEEELKKVGPLAQSFLAMQTGKEFETVMKKYAPERTLFTDKELVRAFISNLRTAIFVAQNLPSNQASINKYKEM